ncbi:MAG TPA: hypothetical protein VLQ92_01495 [Candidatus Limnocylindrales bacterium]|nr:hypothetical protein [Candidatus Limnocylindrales bacterium]
MTDEQGRYGWPEEEPDGAALAGPGVWQLVALYGLPFLILLVVPAVAWVGLLPGAVALRWMTRPPHRRWLVAIYLVAGLISVAPWIAMVINGDIADLAR